MKLNYIKKSDKVYRIISQQTENANNTEIKLSSYRNYINDDEADFLMPVNATDGLVAFDFLASNLPKLEAQHEMIDVTSSQVFNQIEVPVFLGKHVVESLAFNTLNRIVNKHYPELSVNVHDNYTKLSFYVQEKIKDLVNVSYQLNATEPMLKARKYFILDTTEIRTQFKNERDYKKYIANLENTAKRKIDEVINDEN